MALEHGARSATAVGSTMALTILLAKTESRNWRGGSRWSAGQGLGVQEFDRLFVNFHVLSERDG